MGFAFSRHADSLKREIFDPTGGQARATHSVVRAASEPESKAHTDLRPERAKPTHFPPSPSITAESFNSKRSGAIAAKFPDAFSSPALR